MQPTVFYMLSNCLGFAVQIYRLLSVIFIGLPLRLFTPKKPKIKLPSITNDILLLSVSTLTEKIRTKQLTATSIMRAYIERVKEVNPVINAVVEDRFASAVQDAEKVDQFIASGQLTVDELKMKFPLLGVPFSVKESIAVEGLSNNAGLKCSRKKAKENAESVRLLVEAGGIPFLVSNTPELCLNYESYNNITGRTLNPYDTNRTPGGSSGGEASLLASGCSAFGVGSDIGGSLRLPAHFCGIWSHKPTNGLISTRGHFPNSTDNKNWKRAFTLGPMTKYSSDLALLLRIMSNSASLENRKTVDFSKLKIFYLEDNGWISRPTNSEIRSAIRKTAVHFKNEHKTEIQKVNSKRLNYITMFGTVEILSIRIDDIFDNDPRRSVLAEFLRYLLGRSDYCFLSIIIVLIQRIMYFFGINLRSVRPKDTIEKLGSKLGNDGVLICPTFPEPAHIHYEVFVHLTDAFYMLVFNYLGLPVTNCPVGFDKHGLPIGIQVVANRNCDRLTLAVAEEIGKLFGGWSPP